MYLGKVQFTNHFIRDTHKTAHSCNFLINQSHGSSGMLKNK